MSDRATIAKFRKACRMLDELSHEGFHFFTNGTTLHMLTKHKENGGEIIATAPVRNIEGGDW